MKRGPIYLSGEPEAEEYVRSLNPHYAPIHISDSFTENAKETLASLAEVSWSSLYALAAIIIEHAQGLHPIDLKTPRPAVPNNLDWSLAQKAYTAERDRQLQNFQKFLKSWGINALLTNPDRRTAFAGQQDYGDPGKVLGLHYFSSREQVKDYIRRWHLNPLIRAQELRDHPIIAERGIDLICAELIANAFDHSTPAKAGRRLIVMAKYCSVKSYDKDIELDRNLKHLAGFERNLYHTCQSFDVPHLQVVIADFGTGIDDNPLLKKRFKDINDREGSAHELLHFALRGDITTKTADEIAFDWGERLKQLEKYTPAVHGLSEVRRYLKRLGGFWRIHSNETVLQMDSLQGTETVSELSGRPIPGCLHYLAIPLRAEIESASPPELQPEQGEPNFEIFDLAESVDTTGSELVFDHNKLWEALVAHGRLPNPRPLLVLAYVLDVLEDPEKINRLCPVIADVLNRFFKERAIFFCGGNAIFQSLLPRYTGNTEFMRPTTLVVIAGDRVQSQKYPLELYCAEKYMGVRDRLHRALTGGTEAELVPSYLADSSVIVDGQPKPEWSVLQQICHENRPFFARGSAGSEKTLRAAYSLARLSPDHERLFRGGRSFREIALYLKWHKCYEVPQDATGGFLRFGERLNSYLHLARLCADRPLHDAIAKSFLAQLRVRPDFDHITRESGRNLVVVGLLHPSIEIAHEFVELAGLPEAEVMPLARMAETYWDAGPLLQCTEKEVIVIVDFIRTARTLERLLETLDFLQARVHRILSVLTVETPASAALPVTSFCQCPPEEFQAFCRQL